MERPTFNALLVSFVLLIAAFVGFLFGGSPAVTPAPPPALAPAAASGWCCMTHGDSCLREPESALSCLRKGGTFYSMDQQKCDGICRSLQPPKK